MAVLRAVAGPIQGAIFQLSGEEVTVGRLASSPLCIGDPSVSRQHCCIQALPEGFRIRDLGSSNGTFVNGNRIEEYALAEGDEIRIGDTLLRFTVNGAHSLPDNGIVAHSSVQSPASEAADTAIRKLLESAPRNDKFAAQARSLLKIGARLSALEDPEVLEDEILKHTLEAVPADQAAIVLLARNADEDPTIRGWNRSSGAVGTVPVSRTLVARAIRDGAAIFSDDVISSEFADITSLAGRHVHSIIVVPLAVAGEITGTIYLESADPGNRLDGDHLELVSVIAEHAGPALYRARRLKSLSEDNRHLRSALDSRHCLIGRSLAMRQVLERIAKVARTDATVMLRGETGTGKELAARAIHQNSLRVARPFEAINCSLLRDALLETELFGHEKGSFTGAVAQKKGKIESAAGGTLFLDELASLGESPQAMLLRVLQTREFQRLGGNRTLYADVRIIAATNEDLEEAVRKKMFRQDLYYRLNVVSITMPPLRERRDDIPLLADHFLKFYSHKNKRLVTGVSTEAAGILLRHDWQGNVRELENAVEHAIVFGATSEILPEDLPEVLLEPVDGRPGAPSGYHDAVREAKHHIILSAIRNASGDYHEAAKLLEIHVNNLHRLIRELNLKPHVAGVREPGRRG